MLSKRRKSMPVQPCKLINCIFTCGVLLVSFNFANCNLTSQTDKINNDLQTKLDEVLNTAAPNYTDIFDHEVCYSVPNKFDPRGMDGLYDITTRFMKLILPQQIFPEGFVKVEDGHVVFESSDGQWHTLLTHYSGLLALVIVLLTFGILIPIIGLFFCCCRCCGNCGASPKPMSKGGDLCKNICFASILIALGSLMLFGVVCAFATNQQMQDGTQEFPENLNMSVQDIGEYLNTTVNEIHVLLSINYRELEDHLFFLLDSSSEIISDQLEEISSATALSEVVAMVDDLDDIESNLTAMQKGTSEIISNSLKLQDGLKKVKDRSVNVLKKCSSLLTECDAMVSDIKTLTSKDFTLLPDISNQIDNLKRVLSSDIHNALQEGQEALRDIQVQINETVSAEVMDVKEAITAIGDQVIAGVSNITSVLKETSQILKDYTQEPLQKVNHYLGEYSLYRYYPELAICCILLIIMLCIVFGLICGIFGKQSVVKGNDCCSKATGARFLIIGVGVMFTLSLVLMVVIIIHLLLGSISQRLVCDSFRDPNNSQILKLADEILDLQASIGSNVDISTVVNSCHQNLSIYKVFEMETVFDVDELITYLNKFEINQTLAKIVENIQANTNIVILTPEAERRLGEIISSGIGNIPYDQFIKEFHTNITSVDLDGLADQLDKLIPVIEGNVPNFPGDISELKESAKNLREYQQQYVVPMMESTNEMMTLAENLEESLKFGKESFEAAINSLIGEIKIAEAYLKVNGTDAMTKIATNFVYGIERKVRNYLYRVINNTKDNIGQCGPISDSLNSTLVATCDQILLPWNGFWFSLMWCMFLLIPTIIFSVVLAAIYQKYDPRPQLREGDEGIVQYMPDVLPYYQGAQHGDRDQNFVKIQRPKLVPNQNQYERRAVQGMSVLPHYQDREYSDMAPSIVKIRRPKFIHNQKNNERRVVQDMPVLPHYQDHRYGDMAPRYQQ